MPADARKNPHFRSLAFEVAAARLLLLHSLHTLQHDYMDAALQLPSLVSVLPYFFWSMCMATASSLGVHACVIGS